MSSSSAGIQPIAGKNIAQTVLEAAPKPFVLLEVDGGVKVFAVPPNYHLQTRDTVKEDPERRSGTAALDTVDSFVHYVNAFKVPRSDAASRIYCQADFLKGAVNLTAILNDHGENGQYRDFRATYAPKLSEEWKVWNAASGTQMNQEAFATFVENNLRDIATVEGMPTGSEMYQMALQFEITKDASFRSVLRPQSGGVAFEYVDQENPETSRRMQAFDRFAVGIAPFWGGTVYRVDAKLRYRLAGSRLSFWYELIRPDLTIADAVKAELAKVAEATGLPVLMGRLL